jgi:hypothetical protein
VILPAGYRPAARFFSRPAPRFFSEEFRISRITAEGVFGRGDPVTEDWADFRNKHPTRRWTFATKGQFLKLPWVILQAVGLLNDFASGILNDFASSYRDEPSLREAANNPDHNLSSRHYLI